jgi:uncharacterized protein YjbJ (UPF0337 family)
VNNEQNWNKVQGTWETVKGTLREKWGKLTDDDIAECKGNREVLIGKIMQRQGLEREVAERQVGEWQTTIKTN